MHPTPHGYLLPRVVLHDGKPTTLQSALRRGADPNALEVVDADGSRKPYLRLTVVQFAYLANLIDTYEHGSTSILGPGTRRVAHNLDARKLAGVLEGSEPGELDQIVITDAGLDVLAERRADLNPEQAARLDAALASPRRATREIAT